MTQQNPILRYIFLLLFEISCATQPVALPPKEPSQTTQNRLWAAAHRVALNYPIRDMSQKDQFIESDWIEEGKHSRYRFFITAGDVPEIIIEIQNQIRPSKKSQWQWSAPSLDKEERLKQAIHAEFQKNL
jgi:hypothetical protein